MYYDPITLTLEWQKKLEKRRYSSKAAFARDKKIYRARITQILC